MTVSRRLRYPGTLSARLPVCCAALIALLIAGASAQTDLSILSGVITAPSGLVVTDAALWITNVQTKAQKKVVTDNAGRYEVRVVPGRYRVTAETSGLAPFDVVIEPGQDVERNVELEVGGVSFRLGVSDRDAPGTSFVALSPANHVSLTEEEKRDLDEWAQRQPVQGPSPIYFLKPVYPEAMREARREGHVTVTGTIAPEGVLADIKITGDEAFIPATREAAGNWQFIPARVQGMLVPVPFALDLAFTISTNEPGR